MSDVLGDDPLTFYNEEEARRYNLSGAFKRIQQSMTYDALSVGEFEKGAKILDIGCGTGFSTEVLIKEGFKAVGCDVNDKMLKFAKKKGIDVVLCDMRKLPFKDNEFDYFISISAIQWLKPLDYRSALREMHRVAKKGGVVQFYPKHIEEKRLFLREAKRFFSVEVYEVGEGVKKKEYVRLKKQK